MGAGLLVAGCPGDDSPSVVDSGNDDTTTGGIATGDASTGVDPTSGGPGSSDEGEPTAGDGTSTGVDTDEDTDVPPECGNDLIEGGELCDGYDLGVETCITQGFPYGGPLGCTPDCMAYDTSNCYDMGVCNGINLDPEEACDGNLFGGQTCQDFGFESGSLSCATDCSAIETDTCGTCGNFIVDGDEVCDQLVLLGQTCVSQGFDNGDLGCDNSNCLAYDTSGCGTCGNSLIEGTQEVCDGLNNGGETCLTLGLGFDSGTLGACMPDCLEFDTSGCGTCGNDLIDGDELCDTTDLLPGNTCVTEGFDNGNLGCMPDCSAYDLSTCGICGNGIIDGSESCDGVNLGGESCASLGLLGGSLACSASCQFDFTSCDIPGIPFGNDSGYNGYALTPPMTTCDDISLTGTPTGLTDDSNQVVNIGFSFPVYGVDMTQANIQSNGTLRFGDMSYLSYTNSCLPTATAPSTNTLYVFWDDLNPGAAGEVYYQTLGPVGDQRFVVQWDTPHFGGDVVDLMRFQVVLHELTGQIDVCYVDTLSASDPGDSGAEATAGIQLDSTDGLQYSCNTASLTNGLQLLYIPM